MSTHERVVEIDGRSCITTLKEHITRCEGCRYSKPVILKVGERHTRLMCRLRPSIQHYVKPRSFCSEGRPRE